MSFRLVSLAALAAVALAGAEPASTSERARELAAVKTVHVEELTGEGAHAIRDLLVSAIFERGSLMLVEDPEIADASIRGSAEDLIFTDYARYRSGINVRGSATTSNRDSGESDYNSASFGVGDTEDSNRRERKHEALAAVRLVLRNGTIAWAGARESNGGKFRGAAADVAYGLAADLDSALKDARRGMKRD